MGLIAEIQEAMRWIGLCFTVLPSDIKNLLLMVLTVSLILSLFGLFSRD